MLKDSLEPARWQITCVTVVTASFAFVYTQRVKPDRFRERKSCAKVLELLRVVSAALALICCAIDKSYASASDTGADYYVRSVLGTTRPQDADDTGRRNFCDVQHK